MAPPEGPPEEEKEKEASALEEGPALGNGYFPSIDGQFDFTHFHFLASNASKRVP